MKLAKTLEHMDEKMGLSLSRKLRYVTALRLAKGFMNHLDECTKQDFIRYAQSLQVKP